MTTNNKHNQYRKYYMMLSFEVHLEGQFTIEALAEGFWKWMSAIEIDAEKYDLKILSGYKSPEDLGRLEVTYNQQRLFLVNFYSKYFRTETGKRGVRGMFTVRVMDEGADLMNPGEHICLNIDDHLGVNYSGKQTNIAAALQDVLPIRDEKQVERIVEVLGVRAEQVKMDTYQKRYVIDMPIPELDWQEDKAPEYVYKYVSLSVFHKMLQNGTFRMHSIVSQSDTQETFYLGDFICSDYENEFKRFNGMLKEQTVLISSFTTEYDKAEMWRDYGDKGHGVCLGFCMTGGQRLHQIQYVNEAKTSLRSYKERVERLKEEGIHVHFSAIDDCHRFVKNDKYWKEKEWRLVVDYDGEVDSALYDKRCVWYKDFEFDGCDLKGVGLQLESILIGPVQPEGTSNFPLLVQMAHKRFGKGVVVNRSELREI